MNDPIKRTIRTAIVAFIGTILTSGVLSAASTDGVVDWSAITKVGIAALFTAVIAVLTFILNWAEDNTNFPALLKPSPPATTQSPKINKGLFQQTDTNKVLIAAAWVGLVVATLANALCLWLWATNKISDRAMLGLTLFLSWLAIQTAAATFLLQALTKRDVDSE